jgi:hypothetical protein
MSSSSSSNSSPHGQHLIATGGRGLSSVCFDGDRRLYATSSNDGTLYVEEDGRLLEVSTTGGVPSGLAIDHTNALHVLDFAHAAVLLVKDEIAAATSHHAHHNIGQVAPSASSSSTTRRSSSAAARAPTSTSRRWRATSRRASGTTSS